MAPILVILAFVVIVPFLTYYVTSSLFFRRVNSAALEKKPPTIPYLVAGVFHSVSFAQLGARRYFAGLIKEYGSFAPFKVRAGPRSYTVLRDPTHLRRVLEAPEHLTASAAKAEKYDKLFGSPLPASHLHESETSDGKHAEATSAAHMTLQFPDAALASITDTYISILSANMHDKMFQVDSWTLIEDFWSFLQLVLLRCTLNTLFGSALLKQYPRIMRDYSEFNTAVESFVCGMPRIMLSGATASRDRLCQGMENWLKADRAESSHGDLAGEDSLWDEQKGLRLVRDRLNTHAIDKDERVDTKARAAEVLSIIHTMNTELTSSTFWTTVETLRKSHLVRNMTASVGQHFSSTTNKYDVLGLTQVPLVKSLQTEVRRLRTATCVVRTNKTDGFPLDKHWSLPKGATVAVFSHDVALNTDVWKRMQPRAVEKPLEEFWAERFTAAESKSKSRKSADKKSEESNKGDLGDLIEKLTTCDQYPGSRFVSVLQTATLAVLTAEFEIQLCDLDYVDAVLPPNNELAYGTVRPLDKIPVRIRKRKV